MRFEDDYENSRSEIGSLLALPRWSGFHFQIESLAAIDFYPGAAPLRFEAVKKPIWGVAKDRYR
jgi:hypothetical protein